MSEEYQIFQCSDCDFFTDDQDAAEGHALETGHVTEKIGPSARP